MASSPPSLLALFLAAFCILTLPPRCPRAFSDPQAPRQPDHCKCQSVPSKDSPLLELDRLNTHLAALERSLLDKALALEDKDKTIALLQDEVEVLQRKDEELEAHLKIAHTKLEELEMKVTELGESLKKKELELQQFKEQIQNQDTAEREHLSEFMKIYGGLIPSWAANQITKLQASAATHWASHGEPFLIKIVDKASKKAAAMEKWPKPQFKMMRTHMEQIWSPVLKQHWEKLSGKTVPHVDRIKHKAAEHYEALKAILSPQVIKTQAAIQPYVQVARAVSRPYVEKVAVVIRPHFERLRVNFRTYMEKASRSYKDYLISLTMYCRQLQNRAREIMKNETPSTFASRELIWILALALLVLPIFGILLLFSPSFGGKRVSKPLKSTSSHGHRKTKRPKQVDK